MAEIVNGCWSTPEIVDIRDTVPEVKTNDPIGPLINQLGELVVQAQGLSEEDYRRFTNCIQAAGDLMVSRVRLTVADRQKFETALRDATARKHGVIF